MVPKLLVECEPANRTALSVFSECRPDGKSLKHSDSRFPMARLALCSSEEADEASTDVRIGS
jgi:hypothetical protein